MVGTVWAVSMIGTVWDGLYGRYCLGQSLWWVLSGLSLW